MVAGERRLRAAKKAGLEKVPVILVDINDRESAAIALLENLQREDLNFLEEAEAYYNLLNDADLYATGTTSNGHQGGPAIVGEGKNSEIVDMPNKSPFIVSDATTISILGSKEASSDFRISMASYAF